MWPGSPKVLKSSPGGGKKRAAIIINNKEVEVIIIGQGSHENAILPEIRYLGLSLYGASL